MEGKKFLPGNTLYSIIKSRNYSYQRFLPAKTICRQIFLAYKTLTILKNFKECKFLLFDLELLVFLFDADMPCSSLCCDIKSCL